MTQGTSPRPPGGTSSTPGMETRIGQTVDLNFFGREFLDLGLFWIVASCFAAGLIAALLGTGLREFRLRREIRQLRKQSTDMEKELTDLRALPLEELTGGTPAKGE